MWPRRQDEHDVFEGFGRFGRIWTNPALATIGCEDEPADGAREFADGFADRPVDKPGGAAPVRRLRTRRGVFAIAGVFVAAVFVAALVTGSGGPAESGSDESDRAARGDPAEGAGPAIAATSERPVAPARAPIVPPAVPGKSRGKVVVLDQSAVPTLADSVVRRLRAAGWEVTGRAVFHGVVPTTTVYHPRGQEDRARVLRADVPGIGRTRPVFPGILTDRLTVIVVDDRPAPIPGRPPGVPGVP